MRFVVKYPTRGRPTLFLRQLQRYRSMASRKHPIKFVVSVDEDDASMQCEDVRRIAKATPNLFIYHGRSTGKIAAVNADMDKLGDYDIMILASDDMIPQMVGYDDLIATLMQKHFPNLDGVLHFRDGLNHANLNTMPIAGKKFIDEQGYIYHPDYISEFCDNHFQCRSEKMGKSVKIDQVLFKHEWTKHTGIDSTFKRNSGFWDKDKATFERHQALGFPK